jgi:hypothetical protein
MSERFISHTHFEPYIESVSDQAVFLSHEEEGFRFECCQSGESGLRLRLEKTKLTGKIAGASWKKKKDKFVITLTKKDVKPWGKLGQ